MALGLVDGLYAVMLLAGAGLCFLGVYSARRWDEPGLGAFVVLVVVLGVGAVASGSFGFAERYLLGTNSQAFFAPLTASAVLAGGVVWLVFCLQYNGRWTDPSPARIVLLAVPTLATIFTLWPLAAPAGSDATALYTTVLNIVYGLGFFYTVAMYCIGAFLLVRTTYVYGHLSLKQGSALATGPLALVVATVVGPQATRLVGPIGLQGSYALGLLVTAVALTLAVFRYDTFHDTPAVGSIGRQAVSREIDDLIVVTDNRERVIELNEAVEETLDVDPSVALGHPVDEVLDKDVQTLQDRETVDLHTVDGHREFDPQVSELTDQHGRWLGYLLSLHDVTDRHIRRQRLDVLNRVLRHNLRNKLTVVEGNARAVTKEQAPPEESVDRILAATDDLISLSERAKAVQEYMDDGDATTHDVVLPELIETIAARVREQHPEVDLTVDVPESLVVPANEGLLAQVLENAVENGAAHNDADSPRVEITVSADGDAAHPVTVEITDNGPGIPDHELAVIRAGRETPLEHGSGLGLWVLSWGTRQLRGELEFEERDPRGTVVRIELPTDPVWPTDDHSSATANSDA